MFKAIEYQIKPRNDDWTVKRSDKSRVSRVFSAKKVALQWAVEQASRRQASTFMFDSNGVDVTNVYDVYGREILDISSLVASTQKQVHRTYA